MKKLLNLLFLAILIAACQPAKETKDESVSESFDQERDAFFSNMLPLVETAAALQATAADFNASLLHNPALFDKYTTVDTKAAANLGIYLADLNYCAAYKESDHSKQFFTAAQELSKSVDVEQSVLFFLMLRYEDNISNNDSLKAVVNNLFKNSETDVEGAARKKLVGIAMAAYQIENLHLGLGIIETYPKDMLPDDARIQILIPVFRMVLDQQKNVENIYSFLKSISDPAANANHAYYLTAFEELISVYKKLDVDEKIANNQGLELMNDAVVKELSTKVNAIRTEVVTP